MMLQTQPQSVYSDRELVAAEGLIMLWRSWQTPMRVPAPAQLPTGTALNEVQVTSSVRTPPVSRQRSPTEAYLVPKLETPQISETSHILRNYKREDITSTPTVRNFKVEAGGSRATETLKEAISQAINTWRSATLGAESVPAKTVAKITHDAVVTTTQREMAGPSACLTPINNLARIPRRLPKSSSDRNKENIRIKREARDYEERESKPCVQLIPIGDGNARIPAYILKTIDWKRYKAATRTLLEVVFGRSVLATHNLTGKPSPAFPNRVPKGKLDEVLVRDIVQTVVVQSGVSASLVRSSITSKCADEGKMYNERKYNSYSYYDN